MKSRASESKLSRGQRLQLNLLWGCCCGFSYLPRWVRYHLVQPLIVLLLLGIRYRRRVILSNLERSFPEKSPKELRRILYNNYRILAEVIVDTISLAGVSAKRKDEFIVFRGIEEHIAQTKGRDWIALASHYGCWEYFMLYGWFDPESTFLGVYHPLRSPIFEAFYNRLRGYASNILQVPMKECVRHYLRYRGEGKTNLVLGLIADQNPPLRPDSHWFRFLNQDTVFFDGGEKLALRFHIPVYFIHVERLEAGCYEVRFEQIYDGESEVAPNEITERYVRLLEQMIVRKPELWMWSHRRWKHRREHQYILR